MSFFKSLVKGTFDIVQRDISAGIKSITTNESKKSVNRTGAEDFNEHAGADLLHSYQENWKEIHVTLDENAKQAQKADEVICAVDERLGKERDTLSEFVTQLSGLPELTEQINQIVVTISALTETISDTENLLITLEDVCEQQELKANKLQHKNKLATYSHAKSLDVERVKVQLARKHAKDVQQFESKLQRNLKDRQEAFEATYKEEIEKYRSTGETGLKPNIVGAGPSLADIEVGEDQAKLDAFLENDEQENPSEDKASENKGDDSVTGTAEDAHPEVQVKVTPDADIAEQDLKQAYANNNAEKMADISETRVTDTTLSKDTNIAKQESEKT